MVRVPLEKKPLDPQAIAKLIDKGASVKNEISLSRGYRSINLRVPEEMLDDINDALKKTVGISRTGWILQALNKVLTESKTE
jgi:hypothetical protein